MDFKEKLGENFREDMTANELLEVISQIDIPEPLDSDKFKKAISDANSEAAKYKKELKALQQSLMTDEERRKMEQVALEESERERSAREAEKDATICRLLMEREFAAGGFGEKEWKPLIESYPATNPDQAVSYAKNLVSIRAKDREFMEQQIKEQLNANMSRPQSSPDVNSKKDLTLSEIMQIANEGKLNEAMRILEQE